MVTERDDRCMAAPAVGLAQGEQSVDDLLVELIARSRYFLTK